MNVDSPFPPPDDELCALFGKAMFYAHKLEHDLKAFLYTAEYIGEIEGIRIDPDKFRDTEAFFSRASCGILIGALRESGQLADKKTKKILDRACEDRNRLAHRFFCEVDPTNLSFEEQRRLKEELRDILLDIYLAFSHMREKRQKVDLSADQKHLLIKSFMEELQIYNYDDDRKFPPQKA